MGITVRGDTQLAGRLTDATFKIDPAIRKALSKTGTLVRRQMKAAAPRKDGDLINSITMRSRGTTGRRTVTVGPVFSKIAPEPGDHRGPAAQRYPAYQENGTARMAAHPFVEQSLNGAVEDLTARLNAIIPELGL